MIINRCDIVKHNELVVPSRNYELFVKKCAECESINLLLMVLEGIKLFKLVIPDLNLPRLRASSELQWIAPFYVGYHSLVQILFLVQKSKVITKNHPLSLLINRYDILPSIFYEPYLLVGIVDLRA